MQPSVIRSGLESPAEASSHPGAGRLRVAPHFEFANQVCYDCSNFPCTCRRMVEPCVCGGLIEPPSLDPMAVAAAVRVHNRSTAHQQWRDRAGW